MTRTRPTASTVLMVLLALWPVLLVLAVVVFVVVAFFVLMLVQAFQEGFGPFALIFMSAVVWAIVRGIRAVGRIFSIPRPRLGGQVRRPPVTGLRSARDLRAEEDEYEAWRHHGW